MYGDVDIRITSNQYEESLVIRKSGLTLMPKENCGEVTLKQKDKHCVVVDVGKDGICTLQNMRFIVKDSQIGCIYDTDQDFDQKSTVDVHLNLTTNEQERTQTSEKKPLISRQ